MLKTRIISAVVALSFVGPALVWGGVHAVEALVLLVGLIGVDEYARMVQPAKRWHVTILGGALGIGLVAANLWGLPLLPLLAGGLLVALSMSIMTDLDNREGMRLGNHILLAALYAPFLLSFLAKLRDLGPDGLTWLFLVLVVTWLGDSGAYFSGRALGKTKLAPLTSPNKTWEGAVGGALAAMAGAALMQQLYLPQLPLVHALILGLLIDVAGVTGDLVESNLKRATGVKDSGSLMPGHGGALDRVDSLLFAGPVAWLYLTSFGLV